MSESASSKRLLEIEALRVLSCLGVLLIHACAIFWWRTPAANRGLYFFATANEIGRFALFGFVFIAGFLLTLRQSRAFEFRSFLQRRFSSIFIPYLTWNFLYFLFQLRTNKITPEQLENPTVWLNWFLFGCSPHLYFVALLFQLYLLYAVAHKPLQWLLEKPARMLWGIAALLALYPIWIGYRFLPDKFPHLLPPLLFWLARNSTRTAPEWFVPFFLGLFVGKYRALFEKWVHGYRPLLWGLLFISLALASAMTVQATPDSPGVIFTYRWPNGLLLPLFRLSYAFAFTALLLPTATHGLQRLKSTFWVEAMTKFATASFGIYLIHPLVLLALGRLRTTGRLYTFSPPLYLVTITLALALLSWLCIWAVDTAGNRWKPATWISRLLLGH
ncbi:MAG: acyltransferase [Anaerolineae bacterium]|nr:acyltransferase [Gloeobacterales cyanobacterium ES-bin-313]